MNKIIGTITKFATIGCLLWSSSSSAAVSSVVTDVERTMVDSERFGGCMVLLADMPATLNCPDNWVSASCSGDFNSSNMGWRKFESAQIAKVADNRVRVYVDDGRKHNGRCFMLRIDLY
ncbi:MAG: hypothetical protein RIC89_17860 [Pseudomonadales bacterium]